MLSNHTTFVAVCLESKWNYKFTRINSDEVEYGEIQKNKTTYSDFPYS